MSEEQLKEDLPRVIEELEKNVKKILIRSWLFIILVLFI